VTCCFFFQAEDGIRDWSVTGVQTCALPIWLRRGVTLLLFPEGTRSPDGEVKAFKDGAFRLSITERVPLIPIALAGTADILPKHRSEERRVGKECRSRRWRSA